MGTRRFSIRRRRGEQPDSDQVLDQVELDPDELTGLFPVPDWLQRLGMSAWFLVGVALLIGALVWLASLTEVILMPMITAAIVATVLGPVVTRLAGIGLPRGLGAVLILLGLVAVGFGLSLVILHGIVGEAGSIERELKGAVGSITDALKGTGLTEGSAGTATERLSSGGSNAVSTLLTGVLSGIRELSSLFFFAAMMALGTFFMLKDGPTIGTWAEDHSGLPRSVARVVSSRVASSMRGYFTGVTIVAAFSAAVVAVGSLIIGVPHVAAIVTVTFIAGYIPYLGAWSAGVFSVLIALGAGGESAAIGMIVVQLLANGILQQMVQPFAMGATLGIHPLVVLVVTIAGGALFGAIGLIVAAPLVAAAVGIAADLKRVREPAPGPGPATAEP
ncbi:MAG: AI-2E family transporter [Solirubrobacterales bacterium]|nr:AI-2E family transporter [Solirubrobacterales bacterium]